MWLRTFHMGTLVLVKMNARKEVLESEMHWLRAPSGGPHRAVSIFKRQGDYVRAVEFVCLLQTERGLALWNALRDDEMQINKHLWFFPPRTQLPQRRALELAAGAYISCRVCCRRHDVSKHIHWYCRIAGYVDTETAIFNRARHSRQCYILLCGIKKFRNSPLLVPIDRFVVRQIAHTAWSLQFYDIQSTESAWAQLILPMIIACHMLVFIYDLITVGRAALADAWAPSRRT